MQVSLLIFQDLVEAGILYTAVFEGKSTVAWRPEMLSGYPEITAALAELPEEIQGIIHVYDVSGGLALYYDMGEERLLICATEKVT